MSVPDPYARIIRQAAHDTVHSLLTTPPDSLHGSQSVRAITTWLGDRHGPAAVRDLAEELAADLAEAFDTIAHAENRSPTEILDGWFHDHGLPDTTAGHRPDDPARAHRDGTGDRDPGT